MNLPSGRLLRRRVVENVGTVLDRALEAELTGYARLVSQDALLLDGDGVGVLTFQDGIPSAAYHTGTDAAGQEALADIAVAGPYRLELYELEADVLAEVHGSESVAVPPTSPARRLSGDPQLIERTRGAAPADRLEAKTDEDAHLDAVASFLDDEERIETIRDRAREEARSRADEWGFEPEI